MFRYTETMTIDERLDRLTERHEALTQSIELMLADHRAMIEGQRAMVDGQRVLVEGQRNISRDIEALKVAAQHDGENIRALARIAEIHERRPSQLEGQE